MSDSAYPNPESGRLTNLETRIRNLRQQVKDLTDNHPSGEPYAPSAMQKFADIEKELAQLIPEWKVLVGRLDCTEILSFLRKILHPATISSNGVAH